MEDDLVVGVSSNVVSQGSLQLEGDVVADVVVSGVFPDGCVLGGVGVVLVVDLLDELRNVGLVGDLEVALLGQLQQSQVVSGAGDVLGDVNDQVVTCVQSGLAVDTGNALTGDVGVSDLSECAGVVVVVCPAGDGLSDVDCGVAVCEVGADGCISLQGCQEALAVDAGAPGDVTQLGLVVGGGLSTCEDLVCLVNVAAQVSISCESGGCQGHDHQDGQCHGEKLSHVFHNVRFLSFMGGVWFFQRVRIRRMLLPPSCAFSGYTSGSWPLPSAADRLRYMGCVRCRRFRAARTPGSPRGCW